MTTATRPTNKMSIFELRELAQLNGITTSLYGTSKAALVIQITMQQREAKTA